MVDFTFSARIRALYSVALPATATKLDVDRLWHKTSHLKFDEWMVFEKRIEHASIIPIQVDGVVSMSTPPTSLTCRTSSAYFIPIWVLVVRRCDLPSQLLEMVLQKDFFDLVYSYFTKKGIRSCEIVRIKLVVETATGRTKPITTFKSINFRICFNWVSSTFNWKKDPENNVIAAIRPHLAPRGIFVSLAHPLQGLSWRSSVCTSNLQSAVHVISTDSGRIINQCRAQIKFTSCTTKCSI